MTGFIELNQVVKRFGDTEVLSGIDLSIDEHEVVCLIGASGSGKSTLLRCVNGLEPIASGTITVGGRPVIQHEAALNRLRREVGIVFQSYNLFPHMTVLSNITLAPRRVLGISREAAEANAQELLDRIGLTEMRNTYPDRLSGGQQQRVAIVRALAMKPRALLLDEITAALDPELVGEVLAIVRELVVDGMTMMLATHEMGFAREVSNRIAFLDHGVIAEIGPPDQIFGAPQNERTESFLRRVIDPGSRTGG